MPSQDDTALPLASRTTPPLALRLLVWAIMAAGFAALAVNWSMHYGRLVGVPQYDDNGYFVDGLERLNDFYRGGLRTLAKGYAADPPHAPFSSTLAFTSFGVMGVHDWAPYAGNAVVLFALLCFVDHLMRGTPLWQRIAAGAFALTVPLAHQAILEFRPDIACSLAIAIGIVTIVSRPLHGSAHKHKVLAGVAFGAAMLIKPAFFPATCIYLGASLVLASIVDRMSGRKASLGSIVRDWAWCVAPALLIALPHYAVATGKVIKYVKENMVGETAFLWRDKNESLSHHVLYFLTGQGGKPVLGQHLYLLVAVLAGGGVLVALTRRRERILRAVALGLMIVLAYLIPTVNVANRHQFWATVFDLLLIFAAVMSFRLLLAEGTTAFGAAGREVPKSVFLAIVLVGLLLFSWPYRVAGVKGSEIQTHQRELLEKVYATLRGGSHLKNTNTFFNANGEAINRTTMRYRALKDGPLTIIDDYGNRVAERMTFDDLHKDDDLAEYNAKYNEADMVVAGEPGNSENWGSSAHRFPSVNAQDKTLALLRGRTDYVQIAEFMTDIGPKIYIFERKHSLAGWADVSGGINLQQGGKRRDMIDNSWAVPGSRHPLVGLRSHARLQVRNEAGGKMKIEMRAKPVEPGVELIVQLDGKELARRQLPGKGGFNSDDENYTPLEIPVELPPGVHHVELLTKKEGYNPIKGPAVLFHQLRILPVQ